MRLQHYPVRWVWLSVGTLITSLVLACVWILAEMRQNVKDDGAMRLSQFAHATQSAMNRSMSAIDLLLASVDDMLQLDSADLPDRRYTLSVLQLAVRQNPLVQALSVVNADGNLLASSDNLGHFRAEHIPEQWLRSLSHLPSTERNQTLHLHSPADEDERYLYIARFLRDTADGMATFVVAKIPRHSWIELTMQNASLQGLEMTLERQHGEVVLSAPRMLGQPAQQSVQALDSSVLQPGLHRSTSRLNGQPALVTVTELNYDRLMVVAALPEQVWFVHWRETRNALLAGVAVFSGLLLLGAALIQTYLRHMQRAQQQVLDSRATLQSAMESMAAGVLQLDAQGRILLWNQKYAEMFPEQVPLLAQDQTWQHVLEQLAQLLHRDQCPHSETVQLQCLLQDWERGESTAVEVHTQLGQTLQMSIRGTADGGCVVTCENVTAIRSASAEIEQLAFYDALTGLPNRRLLMDRLGQALHQSKRAGWLGALMFIDMNKFKLLNDTQGHDVGDLMLQQVAQRLRASVRASDTVARLGGDEFVVMLCDLPTDLQAAAKLAGRIAQKMQIRLSEPYELRSYVHRSTASFGVTMFGHGEIEPGQLLSQADIAMYQAKASDTSRVCFFEPHMQEALHARAQLERDLRQAVSCGQLSLHYQPQFTAQGHIDGIEALLRWEHPERGMVSPSEFIPVAEDSDLILGMGHWVLKTACAQLARWQKHPRLNGVHVAVNVSARQFRQHDFVSQVLDCIAQAGISPQLLKMELTESLVIDDVADTIAKMQQLHAAGVRFSMDDFGTGQSSLSYLTQLPLHQLKIDQSFVRHLGERHTDDVVAQTIIGMAHHLGLRVIAEGVEHQQQVDCLLRFGCQCFQGYFYCRPLPATALEQFVERMPATQPAMLGTSVAPTIGVGVHTLPSAAGGHDDASHNQRKSHAVVEVR